MNSKIEKLKDEVDALIQELKEELSRKEKDPYASKTVVNLRTSINHLKVAKDKIESVEMILKNETIAPCRASENKIHCKGKTLLIRYLANLYGDVYPIYTEVNFVFGGSNPSYKADVLAKIGEKWHIIEIETQTHSKNGESHMKNMVKLKEELKNIKFPHVGVTDSEKIIDEIRRGNVEFHMGYTDKGARNEDFIRIIENVYGKKIGLNLYYIDVHSEKVEKLS